ncbi:hypothetical protein LZ554_002823 [Drepanopeziza brunnea f. sp. 'monogermtubi']|nr:hypothetical protein LZ554_002823 [Drepanopeziza brunnea f. sp. 'monogermtubi']
MAPPLRSTNENEPIDLTSDGEDTSYLPLARNPINFLPSSSSRAPMPTSLDGLPNQDGFVRKSRPLNMNGHSGAQRPPPQNRSSSRGNYQIVPSRGTEKERGSQSHNAVSAYPPNSENDRPPISNGSAPVMNQSVKRKRPDTSPTAASPALTGRHAASLPPASKKLANSSRNPIPASSNLTVITGETRSTASGIDMTSSPNQLAKVDSQAYVPRMEHVLQTQVLAHVHNAVKPFDRTLSHIQRTEIGQTVASKVVSQPSFMQNYVENGKKISPDYERRIAQEARNLVSEEVKKILDQFEAESSGTSKENSPGPTAFAKAPSFANGNRDSMEHRSENHRSLSEENSIQQPSLKLRTRQSTSRSTSDVNGLATSEAFKGHEAVSDSMDLTYSSARPSTNSLPLGQYLKRRRRRRTQVQIALENSLRDSDKGKNLSADSSGQSTPQTQEKRRRRTKFQMEEARASEAAARGFPTSSFQQATPNVEHSGTTSQVLAKGNFARAAGTQPSLAAPVYRCPANSYSPDDYDLRPYIPYRRRQTLKKQLMRPSVLKQLSNVELEFIQGPNFHCDFSEGELRLLCDAIIKILHIPWYDVSKGISGLMKVYHSNTSKILREFEKSGRKMFGHGRHEILRTRNIQAILDFLEDARDRNVGKEVDFYIASGNIYNGPTSITALLRERESDGITPVRSRRGQNSSKVMFQNHFEDSLIRQSEWTDCSGDISSIAWTGENAFIGGALAHSDSHNMQYNKPGNLLVGSLSLDTVRSYPNHKTARPLVAQQDNAENSMASMRTTQSPWLYDSVVSTAHCEYNGYSFTASFDGTVKVWSVAADGSSMTLRGTWKHEGKVNFVVTSPHHDRIATAFETNCNAVRIYNFDPQDISNSSYDNYCGNKTAVPADELRRREKWAYQPATMQWGKSPGVVHMLLVGYSPRSDFGDEHEIPEEKRNTGELCMWNSLTSEKVLITSAKTQNVFEVIWHPTQPIFVAATSPCGTYDTDKTRTQIRLFGQSVTGQFSNMKTLDCPALDINELTIMPNSNIDSFVTASCTDGLTYVWDTIRGDQPIHILQHGESLDNPDPDQPREIGDSGVKFAAWGRSPDRFYTGGSDGMVKAWNIRAPPGKAFVRNVLSVSGGISTGVFNRDCSRLLIGDATGKVYFLGIDDGDIAEDFKPAQLACPKQPVAFGSQLPAGIKRPKVIIPHAEPPPPLSSDPMDPDLLEEFNEPTGAELSRAYLDRGILEKHPNAAFPNSQRAVFQGPAYLDSGLFNFESHVGGDATQELLPIVMEKQQFFVNEQEPPGPLPCLRIPQTPSDHYQHQANVALDFDFGALSLEDQKSLLRDEVELYWDDYEFEFERLPSKTHWPRREKASKNKAARMTGMLNMYDSQRRESPGLLSDGGLSSIAGSEPPSAHDRQLSSLPNDIFSGKATLE